MPSNHPESTQLLTDGQRAEYRAAIEHQGATAPCNRCGAPFRQFGMVGATSNVLLYSIAEAVRGVQERYIPVVTLSCLNCGAIYQHSTIVLDALIKRLNEEQAQTVEPVKSDD